MTENSKYPRVIVVSMGRINAADTSNNGLLLRNLFGGWPKECLAQVFSSDDNGDAGFFGQYYRLSARERRLGRLYYRLKAEAMSAAARPDASTGLKWIHGLGNRGRRLVVDTGLYELIFKIRLSRELRAWVANFRPDFIFAQGYSLAFTQLPLLLAEYSRAQIVYYPTDDWANELYHPRRSPAEIVSRWARRVVLSESRRLVERATVRLAFNPYMRDEFRSRYGEEFTVLMHGDGPERFQRARPLRAVADARPLIVCAGAFNKYRWSLLEDIDKACETLAQRGFQPCVVAYPVNLTPDMAEIGRAFRYVRLVPSPTHGDLTSVLVGADILFLPERFGSEVWDIKCSVSSKAHLFMFSGRPIVVYSDSATGVARYAREERWAAVVECRDPLQLAGVLERLITDQAEMQRLIAGARHAAMQNHYLPTIQSSFSDLLCGAFRGGSNLT